MTKIKITIRNTHFVVKSLDGNYGPMQDVMKYLSVYSINPGPGGKKVRTLTAVYASAFYRLSTFRFNINLLKDFLMTCKRHGYNKEDLEIEMDIDYRTKRLGLKGNREFKLRDYQKVYVDILTKTKDIYNLVDLPTGSGKSAVVSFTMLEINKKTIILVLPKYIQKWIDDVKKYTNIEDDEICVIRGGGTLKKTMEEVQEGESKYKIYIMSNRTVLNYVKEYETSLANTEEAFTYEVTPDKLVEFLGVELLINDEVHQEFHSIFKIMLYLNPKKFIGSSATLDSHDKYMRRMYLVMFPSNQRVSNIYEFVRYIITTAIRYKLSSNRNIHFQRSFGYSHILYEQSIMRNSVMLKSYIELIMDLIVKYYIKKRAEGDKLMVFAASIDFCTLLTNHIKRKYSELDVRRYVENDPYANVLEADVTVSTVLSSGTAIDIPNLITVIQTVSIGSLQANKQSMGRLRYIEDKVLDFVYIYTDSIKKQVDLHNLRMKILQPLSKEYKFVEYDKIVKTY